MTMIEAGRVRLEAATCEVKEVIKEEKSPGSEQERRQRNVTRTGPCKNEEAHTHVHKSEECYCL